MKKIVLIVCVLFLGFNSVSAKDVFQYEQTVWEIIKSRFFNGQYSHVLRFEENIRIQLKGDPSPIDSSVVIEVLTGLDSLIETVDIGLVKENPNFILEIKQNSSSKSATSWAAANSILVRSELTLKTDDALKSIDKKRLQFHLIRLIIIPFDSKFGVTNYGGIFDYTLNPNEVEFTEIDKKIIQLVYSKDFYKMLKSEMIQNYN